MSWHFTIDHGIQWQAYAQVPYLPCRAGPIVSSWNCKAGDDEGLAQEMTHLWIKQSILCPLHWTIKGLKRMQGVGLSDLSPLRAVKTSCMFQGGAFAVSACLWFSSFRGILNHKAAPNSAIIFIYFEWAVPHHPLTVYVSCRKFIST